VVDVRFSEDPARRVAVDDLLAAATAPHATPVPAASR
jgi:hypothetical protein